MSTSDPASETRGTPLTTGTNSIFMTINGCKVVVLIEGLRQMYFADDKTSLSVSASEKCSSR